MTRRWTWAGLTLGALAIGGGVWGGIAFGYLPKPADTAALQGLSRWLRPAEPPPPRDRSIPVVAAKAEIRDVPVYLSGVGSVRPLNTVTVRAQVSGRITEIGFEEGQDIRKGDVIARLDDGLYRAQLEQAIAKKAQDEAQLRGAELEAQRLQRLTSGAAATQQQLDNQLALVAQYRALVQSDQAAIDAAQVQLDYTTIRAPIDGRTGIRGVDIGNLVSAGDTTGIVTLSQIRPISVIFSLPQQDLGRITASAGAGSLPVEAFADDGTTLIATGRLTVIDNQVDATTGTVRLRAEFANEPLTLWPGAFVNARLKVETRRQVLTLPSAAVQRGPAGPYVYTVGADQTVAIRPVTVTLQDDRTAVIASTDAQGVAAGDQVVISGFSRLQPGALVRVSTPQQADPAAITVPLTDGAQEDRRRRPDANRGQGGPRAGQGQRQGEGKKQGEGQGDGRRHQGEGQAGRTQGGQYEGEQRQGGQRQEGQGRSGTGDPQERPAVADTPDPSRPSVTLPAAPPADPARPGDGRP